MSQIKFKETLEKHFNQEIASQRRFYFFTGYNFCIWTMVDTVQSGRRIQWDSKVLGPERSIPCLYRRLIYSKCVPKLKWSIKARATPYKSGSSRCSLCLKEKTAIAMCPPERLLNSRTEILHKCTHRREFELQSICRKCGKVHRDRRKNCPSWGWMRGMPKVFFKKVKKEKSRKSSRI